MCLDLRKGIQIAATMSVGGANGASHLPDLFAAPDAFLQEEHEASERCSNAGPGPACPTTPPGKLRHGVGSPLGPEAATPAAASSDMNCSPASQTGSSQKSIKWCLACASPATKGSLCAKRKRVSDNVYDDEKKLKESNPERWKRFMAMRKLQGDEWVRILIDAERTKGGNKDPGGPPAPSMPCSPAR